MDSFTVFLTIFYWWTWAREESDTAFVICLFFRHISFTRYVFSFLTIDALLALSPPLETNSKIRGTNFDAGGVKPLPFSPHVPCLFHPFQDHHAFERHYFIDLSWSGILGVKIVFPRWLASPSWLHFGAISLASLFTVPIANGLLPLLTFIPGDTNHKK